MSRLLLIGAFFLIVSCQQHAKRLQLLTKYSWYRVQGDQGSKYGVTQAFISNSSGMNVEFGVVFYRFNLDSTFVLVTGIDQTPNSEAPYSNNIHGKWRVTRDKKMLLLKRDEQQDYKDRFQIVKLSSDTLLLKKIVEPKKPKTGIQ